VKTVGIGLKVDITRAEVDLFLRDGLRGGRQRLATVTVTPGSAVAVRAV
jgi:hypothetical protein